MQEVVSIIKDLGFPIFVAGWLLLRTDRIMERFAASIDALRLSIERRWPVSMDAPMGPARPGKPLEEIEGRP